MASQSPSSTDLPRTDPAAVAAGAAPASKAKPESQVALSQSADAAADVEPQQDEEPAAAPPVAHRFLLFAAVPSWLVSMIFHVIMLMVLALLTLPEVEKITRILTVNHSEQSEEVEEFEVEQLEPIEVDTSTFDTALSAPNEMVPQQVTEVSVANDIDAAPLSIDLADFSERTAPKSDLLAQAGSIAGSGLEGRGSAQMRGQMVAKFGGNKESEEAVALALAWLAEHQLPDGSWSFDHRLGTCQGRCSHPGNLVDARNGATAMALLPFLGAGQTHMEGKYKQNVEAGLYYLVRNMKVEGNRGDMMAGGGSMYSHGLASIALCEAYAMTQDRQLMAPAQMSLNHIVYAQDPVGGGWRYAVKQPGDTSVVGWQLMALKSGHMAYLQVPPQTVKMASRFLDSVSVDSGTYYGYTGPGKGQATTAVGLLCRMYLGWDKDEGALQRGVEFLSNTGPNINVRSNTANMYYNYYATQVMRHFDGEEWEKWNTVMRDGLVNTQSKEGHTRGSWILTGDHGSERGGRLYCTSMATMILEVYYRHMPIYGKAAAEEDFPL